MIMKHSTETDSPAACSDLMPAPGAYHVEVLHHRDEIGEHLDGTPTDYVVIGAILPAHSGRELCRLLCKPDGNMQYPVMLLSAAPATTPVRAGIRTPAPQHVGDRPLQGSKGQRIEIHPGKHEVRIDGRPVDLTATEFRLLRMFAEQSGWVFSRQHIIEHIRGKGYACTPRSVDVLIVGLRRKLGAFGKRIQTIRGVGYRYRE